jgi:hypothetical protein
MAAVLLTQTCPGLQTRREGGLDDVSADDHEWLKAWVERYIALFRMHNTVSYTGCCVCL